MEVSRCTDLCGGIANTPSQLQNHAELQHGQGGEAQVEDQSHQGSDAAPKSYSNQTIRHVGGCQRVQSNGSCVAQSGGWRMEHAHAQVDDGLWMVLHREVGQCIPDIHPSLDHQEVQEVWRGEVSLRRSQRGHWAGRPDVPTDVFNSSWPASSAGLKPIQNSEHLCYGGWGGHAWSSTSSCFGIFFDCLCGWSFGFFMGGFLIGLFYGVFVEKCFYFFELGDCLTLHPTYT